MGTEYKGTNDAIMGCCSFRILRLICKICLIIYLMVFILKRHKPFFTQIEPHSNHSGLLILPVYIKWLLAFRPVNIMLVRQAQLGASYRVKVFIGQSLTSSPYRVLRDWEG